MTKRAAVVAMLRDGVPARGIARELGVSPRHVHRIRAEYGIAPCPPGPRPSASTLEETFWARSRLTGEGHREWLLGRPVLRWENRRYSARQVAFWLYVDRRAIGQVFPECGLAWCVEPAHMGDAQSRADMDALCVAVFGEVL